MQMVLGVQLSPKHSSLLIAEAHPAVGYQQDLRSGGGRGGLAKICRVNFVRQERGAQTQTFGSGYLLVGWGTSEQRGWRPNSLVCPSKRRENKLFGGISRDFCWDIPGVPEEFEKCSIFGPYREGKAAVFGGARPGYQVVTCRKVSSLSLLPWEMWSLPYVWPPLSLSKVCLAWSNCQYGELGLDKDAWRLVELQGLGGAKVLSEM